MSKETRLVHFTVVDGTEEEVIQLTTALKELKAKLPFDIEFLITDENVELESVGALIKELYKLYQKTKSEKK